LKETKEISIFINSETEGEEKFAWEFKIQQIQLLLINMSYILNTYRPHQSRHQIIEILKHQLKRRMETIQELNQNYEENLKILQQIKFEDSLKRKREETEEFPENQIMKETPQNEIDVTVFLPLFENVKKNL
jgi:hypothetical protein